MTPKERAAMQQALEALESAPVQYDFNSYPMLVMTPDTLQTTLTALREALEQPNCQCGDKCFPVFSGDIEYCETCGKPTALAEQVHTPYCKQAPMCKTPCGNSDCVEQAEQEPFDMDDHPPHRLCECRKCMEYFTPLPDCDAFATSGKPIAEQEPVAVVEITYGREPECYVTGNIDDFPEGVFKLYAAPVEPVKQEPVAWVDKERMQSIAWLKAAPEHGTKLYAAPVRTKDLTDDDIRKLWDDAELDITWFARAVIAADREKNK